MKQIIVYALTSLLMYATFKIISIYLGFESTAILALSLIFIAVSTKKNKP